MSAIFFALISYVGWGSGDIFGTIASRKIGAFSTNFWVFIAAIVMFSLYIPFAIGDLVHFSLTLFVLTVLFGFFYISGNIAFNEGVRISNAPVVGTISGSFPVITLLISVFIFKENISINQAIAALVIFTGIIFTTLDFKSLEINSLIKDKGVLFGLYSMFAWGIYYSFLKIVAIQVGWFWPLYIAFWLFPLTLIFMESQKIKLENPVSGKVVIAVLLAALLIRTADFSFNLALGKGLTALIGPIGGSYPTLYAILAFLIFKDPITRQQIAGIITTLVGIVLLSFFSI